LTIFLGIVSNTLAWAQTLEDVLQSGGAKKDVGEEISQLGYPGLRVQEEEAAIPYMVPKPKEEAEMGLDKKVDPKEYIVGPRDKLTVYIWGQLDQPFVLDVTPEGNVFFPTVGILEVSGYTLAEAKRRIIEKAKTHYQEEDISVELTVLRSFRVFVTGQVEEPGTYRASAVDRVSDMVERAGGFSGGNYSMRNIQVYHSDGSVSSSDVQWFFRTGSVAYNPYVKMGDVIHVPPRMSIVQIFGAVHIPSFYEYREKDTIQTILDLAGGLLEYAFLSQVEVARFQEDGKTTDRIRINLEDPRSQDPGGAFLVKPDDQIFIRSMTDWHIKRRVSIIGEVKYPGSHLIERDKTRLKDIVEQAGGFTEEAYLRESQVIRGRVHREVDPEFQRLRTMSTADMTPQEYEYYKTQSRQRKGVMAIDFVELFESDNMTYNIVLKDGDVIYVPRQRETINLTGQVELPGLITHQPRKDAEFYINRSGGYSWNADKGQTRVIKGSSGLWLKPGKAENLEPGDSVFIPEKPDRDWWGIIKDTAAVLGQVATVVIVAQSIAGN
jgi:protein involved in polysaccharide export with SLBB domain